MNSLPATHAVSTSNSRSAHTATHAVTTSNSRSHYQQVTQWYYQQVTQFGLRELPLYLVLYTVLNTDSFKHTVFAGCLTTQTSTSCVRAGRGLASLLARVVKEKDKTSTAKRVSL